jgi:hypothetical protein
MSDLSRIPTPRTDAATHDDWSGGAEAVEVDVCKSLERELSEALRERDEARELAEFFDSNWRIAERNREAANLSVNSALAKLAKCRKALQLIANEGAGSKILAKTKPARIARETIDATE